MPDVALVALGDQVQALCQASGADVKAFVIFAAETVEFRTPHERRYLVQALRDAADELEKDV